MVIPGAFCFLLFIMILVSYPRLCSTPNWVSRNKAVWHLTETSPNVLATIDHWTQAPGDVLHFAFEIRWSQKDNSIAWQRAKILRSNVGWRSWIMSNDQWHALCYSCYMSSKYIYIYMYNHAWSMTMHDHHWPFGNMARTMIKWHPRRSTCCSSTEMLPDLPGNSPRWYMRSPKNHRLKVCSKWNQRYESCL